MEAIACWIDLAVPYCGDYEEANVWSEEQLAKYRRFQEKRRRMESLEKRNIEEFMSSCAPGGSPAVERASP